MDTLTPLGLSPQPVPPPKPKRGNYIVGGLAIFLGLFVAYLRAWSWSYGQMGAQGWGTMTGSLILPALVAYLIAGRKLVRNFSRFGVWFSGLCLLSPIIAKPNPVNLEHHIGNLMKEAAGTKAVSGGSEIDRVTRDFFQAVLEQKETFENESAPFNAELGKLYSVETFSSRAAMQHSIDAVHGIVAVDQRYSKQIEGMPDRIQGSVDRSTLSDADKRDFMEGLRKSFGNAKALEIRRRAVETEVQWEDATVSLYEFAMTNAGQIRPDGKRLVIGSERTRSEFNRRMEKAQKLRDEIAELNKQLESAQQAALQDAGLTKKDLGVGQGSVQNGK